MTIDIRLFTLAVGLAILLLGHSPRALADCAAQADIPQAQCQVLADLYDATGGNAWHDHSNWLDDNPCTWFGVTCADKSVSRLILTNNGLTGTVPANLTALPDLVWLNLDYNTINGPLPDISGLDKLEGADFYGSGFTGTIPAWTDLPKLNYLNLGNNVLTGAIPASLETLPLLGFLNVEGNQLISAIPVSFLESPIGALGLDREGLCINSSATRDWLHEVAAYQDDLDYCARLEANVSAPQAASGDRIWFSSRLSFAEVDNAFDMDLYLSLALPGSDLEYFIVQDNGRLKAVAGSADPDTWQAYDTDVAYEPGVDSGLQPLVGYQFRGSEPTGEYRWTLRATEPGTHTLLRQSDAALYFSPESRSAVIDAPDAAVIGEPVTFRASASGNAAGTVYHWDFEDGTTATGQSVTHTFALPDRYRVSVTPEVDGVMLPDTLHYLNAGRPIGDTIYTMTAATLAPTSLETRDYAWNDCEPDWSVYNGKYHQLWLESSAVALVDPQRIIDAVSMMDYAFENYSDYFGWDPLPGYSAYGLYLCGTIAGGGTGETGTFINLDFLDGASGPVIKSNQLGGLLHEFIHLWDYRSGIWLIGRDTAHAFTSGMEAVISELMQTGGVQTGWGGDTNAIDPIDDRYGFRHYYRMALNRYQAHDDLDWRTYSSAAFLALAYDDLPVPENKEHMNVQGGLLMSLYRMHGIDGLKKIFRQLELARLAHPAWDDVAPSQQSRAENFMKAVADGLGLDVSDYFTYWKFPVSPLKNYMSIYPASTMTVDKDGDGYSPLQGDLDDANPTVYPYAPELVDGIDNSQDGLVDEHEYRDTGTDFGDQAIELPATVMGTISDLGDEDSFTLVLDRPTTVLISIYSKDSASQAPYSADNDKPISVFAGEVYLDGSPYSAIVNDQMSAPEGISQKLLGAGVHTITVSPDIPAGQTRNPNPGDYELQIFEDDFESTLTADAIRDWLYP